MYLLLRESKERIVVRLFIKLKEGCLTIKELDSLFNKFQIRFVIDITKHGKTGSRSHVLFCF